MRQRSVCPHDCPSTCALDIEVLDNQTIGRVYGLKSHAYTQGVICAKVSRYAERIHHADRLTQPMKRIGNKPDANGRGEPQFAAISWDEAFDILTEKFSSIVDEYGSEAIWPFHYAGTMGLVQRDGLDRFRRALGTSLQHSTYCVALSDAGFRAGTGAKYGGDARLMHHNKLVVVWGGNPVSTQVNVMHHFARAKRENGAQLIVIDPYRTKTADKADMHLMLRPGTDGALACAVMHVLFEEGMADERYLAEHTERAADFRAHLKTRTPEWASGITGLPVEQIREFARLYGSTKQSFIRIGYGFTRSRNGAVNMHAVSCLPAITGAWELPGSGALYGSSDIYSILDKTLIQGLDIPCESRVIDQSRIGQALTGNDSDLQGGPPIKALLVQNTNPAVVAPETRQVLAGLAREDLFTVVHEQFLTETARYADLLLPATMFLEHDDIYTASGHTHVQIGAKLIDAPGEAMSNHWLLQQLATRLGLQHPGFNLSARELIDESLKASSLPGFDELVSSGGLDCSAISSNPSDFMSGFATANKRFHFAPDWDRVGKNTSGMPEFPDHWSVIDEASEHLPLRLVAAPARQFLNSSFTEMASSRRMEKQPHAKMHPDDMHTYALEDHALVTLGNALGDVTLMAQSFDGVQPGTVIVEGLWPNADFSGGLGINTLVSSEPAQPNGGAVFHDTAVWARPAKKAGQLADQQRSLSSVSS